MRLSLFLFAWIALAPRAYAGCPTDVLFAGFPVVQGQPSDILDVIGSVPKGLEPLATMALPSKASRFAVFSEEASAEAFLRRLENNLSPLVRRPTGFAKVTSHALLAVSAPFYGLEFFHGNAHWASGVLAGSGLALYFIHLITPQGPDYDSRGAPLARWAIKLEIDEHRAFWRGSRPGLRSVKWVVRVAPMRFVNVALMTYVRADSAPCSVVAVWP